MGSEPSSGIEGILGAAIGLAELNNLYTAGEARAQVERVALGLPAAPLQIVALPAPVPAAPPAIPAAPVANTWLGLP